MFKNILFFSIIILFLFFGFKTHAQGTLILLVDMSSSVDNSEMQYQMESYVSVLSTLYGLDQYRYEVFFYAGKYSHVVQNGDLDTAINAFREWRRPSGGATCIDGPITHILNILPELPPPVVIDITGDGVHNCESPMGSMPYTELEIYLDRLQSYGVVINTLYIGNSDDEPFEYLPFSTMMRNGFSLTVTDYMRFELALFDKLAREIAMLERAD